MRFLLDEMHAISAAEALRQRGHDVVAVAERADLRGRADDEILAVAVAEDRALVTENVRDFVPLAHDWAATGRTHAGLILTSPVRCNRARRAYPGVLIAALDVLLSERNVVGVSAVHGGRLVDVTKRGEASRGARTNTGGKA